MGVRQDADLKVRVELGIPGLLLVYQNGSRGIKPGTDNEKYSKIDLDNIDSWLPHEVALSLARIVSFRNRKQYEAGLEAGASREWEDMPQVGRNYHAQLDSGPHEPEGPEEEAEGLAVSPLNEGFVEDRDDPGDSSAGEVPFYY